MLSRKNRERGGTGELSFLDSMSNWFNEMLGMNTATRQMRANAFAEHRAQQRNQETVAGSIAGVRQSGFDQRRDLGRSFREQQFDLEALMAPSVTFNRELERLQDQQRSVLAMRPDSA